jgi:hypothetical protein
MSKIASQKLDNLSATQTPGQVLVPLEELKSLSLSLL